MNLKTISWDEANLPEVDRPKLFSKIAFCSYCGDCVRENQIVTRESGTLNHPGFKAYCSSQCCLDELAPIKVAKPRPKTYRSIKPIGTTSQEREEILKKDKKDNIKCSSCLSVFPKESLIYIKPEFLSNHLPFCSQNCYDLRLLKRLNRRKEKVNSYYAKQKRTLKELLK